MDEQTEISLRFGGDQGVGELPLLGALFVAVLTIMLFSCGHRKFLSVFFVLVFFSGLDERIALAGTNIHLYRIAICLGWISLAYNARLRPIKFVFVDKLFLCWVCVNAVAFTVLYADFQAFINRINFGFTAIGSYFLIRETVRNWDELDCVFRSLTWVITLVAIFMVIEFLSGKNPLHVLGGVPEEVASRDGQLRCQGPFAHPIIAGTFGATLFPFAFAAYQQKLCSRNLALVGMISCAVVTITSFFSRARSGIPWRGKQLGFVESA
ncbi:MAG: hypothetical protein V9H26_20080 [Verrucomicrobiota bacterium]